MLRANTRASSCAPRRFSRQPHTILSRRARCPSCATRRPGCLEVHATNCEQQNFYPEAAEPFVRQTRRRTFHQPTRSVCARCDSSSDACERITPRGQPVCQSTIYSACIVSEQAGACQWCAAIVRDFFHKLTTARSRTTLPSDSLPPTMSSFSTPWRNPLVGKLGPLSVGNVMRGIFLALALHAAIHNAVPDLLPHHISCAVGLRVESLVHGIRETNEQHGHDRE
jgi:hypothetical protein